MYHCSLCGGQLRRVHRRFFERWVYLAVYECRKCQRVTRIARPYQYHFGPEARCPRCGTTRLSKLKGRDDIDPMNSGVFNLLERLAGGKLYHCCFCRIQFYDRRSLARRPSASLASPIIPQPDTAKSDG
jgi:DNA-directed RNA polymerase subunit RPC12/RpoP